MGKWLFFVGAFLLLNACYFVHQDKFEGAVHSWIRVDMPFATAVSILESKGMTCDGGNPASCHVAARDIETLAAIASVARIKGFLFTAGTGALGM